MSHVDEQGVHDEQAELDLEAQWVANAVDRAARLYREGDRVGAVAVWREVTVRQPSVVRAWCGVLEFDAESTEADLAQLLYFAGIGHPTGEKSWWWMDGIGMTHTAELAVKFDGWAGVDMFDMTFALMAIGRWYERHGDFVTAAWCYDARHQVIAGAYPWPGEALAQSVRAVREVAATFPDAGEPDFDERLVFIVGVPRSGSTLLAHCLACHPEIEQIGENPMFDAAIRKTSPEDGVIDIAAARSEVRAVLERLPFAATPRRIVNKQLNNWLWAPLILRMFPNARFICIRRDAAETALSCWRTDFAEAGLAWTTTQRGIAEYFSIAEAACRSGGAIAGNRWLDVDFDAFVDDPEPWLRRVVYHLGVAWHDNVLHPERFSPGEIDTASALQARQPIKPPRRWATSYDVQAHELRRLVSDAIAHGELGRIAAGASDDQS